MRTVVIYLLFVEAIFLFGSCSPKRTSTDAVHRPKTTRVNKGVGMNRTNHVHTADLSHLPTIKWKLDLADARGIVISPVSLDGKTLFTFGGNRERIRGASYFEQDRRDYLGVGVFEINTDTGRIYKAWDLPGTFECPEEFMVTDHSVLFPTYRSSFYVVALERSTFKFRWMFQTGGSTQFAYLDSLIILNYDGWIIAVRESDGKLIWKVETGKETYAVPSDLVISTGKIYVGQNRSIFAIDASSGKVVWKKDFNTKRIAATDSAIYAIGTSAIVSLKASDGSVLWTQQFTNMPTENELSNSKIALTDSIMCWTYLRIGYHWIRGIELATGRELWSFKADGQVDGNMIVTDSSLYFTDTQLSLYSVNVVSGTQRWKSPLGFESYSDMLLMDGVIYLRQRVRNQNVSIIALN